MNTKYLRNAGLTAGIALLAFTADAQRGFHGGFGGRVGVGVGFGGVGFRTGFYAPYPRIGFGIGVLPVGYYPFYWGSVPYYYYDGIFYQQVDGGGYQVAVPPVGAEVPKLPKHAHPILIDGQQYYQYQGVYYKVVTNQDGKVVYVVAGKDGVLNTDNGQGQQGQGQAGTPPPPPRVGDLVYQLPDGCSKVKLNGVKYYVSPDGIYYEEVHNGNQVAFRIASLPEPEDQ
jgi:hypothetical protein